MPLPESWVERIFARMAARYGTDWTMKWTGVDLALVKADWAIELERVRPEAIAYALGFLPLERPPTVTQFRETCLRAPTKAPQQERLEAPTADPARLAAELTRLHDLLAARRPLDWAYDLQARESKGEPLSDMQRRAWRAALESPAVLIDPTTYVHLIPDECLPPAMRRGPVDHAEMKRMRDAAHAKYFGQVSSGAVA